MKKKSIRMLLSLFIFLFFFQIGCFKDNESNDEQNTGPIDNIVITEINPTSAIADVNTTFQVTASYSLVSKDSGVIEISFNDSISDGIDSFTVVDQTIVDKGTGTVNFIVNTIPINWDSAGDFQCYVDLSEYPYGSSWVPLTTDHYTIDVTDTKNVK
jgi:hypothetical protein